MISAEVALGALLFAAGAGLVVLAAWRARGGDEDAASGTLLVLVAALALFLGVVAVVHGCGG